MQKKMHHQCNLIHEQMIHLSSYDSFSLMLLVWTNLINNWIHQQLLSSFQFFSKTKCVISVPLEVYL